MISVILVVLVLLLLLFHPLVVPFIAHYVLQDTEIRYTRLEGTLYNGFYAQNVAYKELFKAKEVRIDFDLLRMWRHGFNIDAVYVHKGTLDLNTLPKLKHDNGDVFTVPEIHIKSIILEQVTLVSGNERIGIDAQFDESRYSDAALNIRQADANITSRYASLKLHGSVERNVFNGNSVGTIHPKYFTSYAELFHTIPLRYRIEISHASADLLQASVPIEHLQLKDGNVSIDDAHIAMVYRYSDNRVDLNMSYLLRHFDTVASVTQQLDIAFNGDVQSHIDIEILQTPYRLPEMQYDAKMTLQQGDSLVAQLNSRSKAFQATLESEDMQHFQLHATLTQFSSNVIPSLPALLQNRDLNVSLDTNITVGTTMTAVGKMHLGDKTTTFSGNFEYDGEQLLAQGIVDVHHQATQWNGIRTKDLFPINVVAHYNHAQEGMVALRSNEIYITLFKRSEYLNGWGSYKTSRFDIRGIEEAHRMKLHVNNHIPSLYEFVDSITPLHYKKFEYYDAELYAETTITIDDDVSVTSALKIPWYVAQSDSQTINFGHNSSMTLRLFNRYMTVDEYNVSILDHRIYAKRDSKFFLDANNTIHLNGLWIYDSLKLSGIYKRDTDDIDMRLQGDQFHYNGPEGDVRAAVDIAIVSDAAQRINVEGGVDILEGTVTYYPSKHYLMRDDDIIIIQDVRDPKASNLFVNVQVTAKKPLHYKAHEINLRVLPDITLWKEPNTPLVLLGMATINKGTIMLTDKRYDIYPSKLYFGGETPINPYLDLNILREIDYKKIHIYVTNTLEDPVVLFSSTPSLSQNDIMSYLIFGTPANTAFEGGDELSGASAANLILGMGLKKMIGDTTGIHVDTLNIISSQSGALGFEVGTQVSDKLRILLKNDAKFSAILQYKLNRWLRLDVDVKETGQGINLIYVKDLHDPLQSKSLQDGL